MKLLLDQGLPLSTAEALRLVGIDATHVGEINLGTATDLEILDKAANDRSVVVTLDADFHQHFALTQADRPSVIRVRIEGLKSPGYCKLIQTVLERCSADLEAGAMISVQETQLRIRRLPIK